MIGSRLATHVPSPLVVAEVVQVAVEVVVVFVLLLTPYPLLRLSLLLVMAVVVTATSELPLSIVYSPLLQTWHVPASFALSSPLSL